MAAEVTISWFEVAFQENIGSRLSIILYTICFEIDTLMFDPCNVSFLAMTGNEAGIKPTLNLKVKNIC